MSKQSSNDSPLFKILTYIQSKTHTWEELPDEITSKYNQFMINRFLSSYEYLLPLLDEITVKKLSNEQHYKILYYWLKQTKHYFNYNSYKNSLDEDTNLIKVVSLEYKVTLKDAKFYVTLLSSEQKQKIKEKWDWFLKNK